MDLEQTSGQDDIGVTALLDLSLVDISGVELMCVLGIELLCVLVVLSTAFSPSRLISRMKQMKWYIFESIRSL